jgi:hypothetical protein
MLIHQKFLKNFRFYLFVCLVVLRFYYYLPLGADKPCLWVKGAFEDHRRRLYSLNRIEKIAKQLVCTQYKRFWYSVAIVNIGSS